MRISDWSSDVCSSDLEPRGIAFEAVADAAQVADQGAQFAQGRAQLRQAVVGEAADRAAVLVEDLVGAARGRVQLGQGAVEAVDQPGQLLHEFAIDVADRAVGAVERSEEHTSELQSLMRISYAVFCLK